MATIALIDDQLRENHLPHVPVKARCRIADGAVQSVGPAFGQAMTHATLCARVLDRYAQNYALVSIQLCENMLGGAARCGDLLAALRLCGELDVDIVTMSLGTTDYARAGALQTAVEALRQQGIWLVGALDNGGRVTFPASLEGVLGVVCGPQDLLAPGVYGACPANPYGIDYAAGYDRRLFGTDRPPSNSLAAPVIAARLNDLINRNVQDIPAALAQGGLPEPLTLPSLGYGAKEGACTLPSARLAFSRGIDIPLLSRVLEGLVERHGYSALGVIPAGHCSDPRVYCGAQYGYGERDMLTFAEYGTTADLVLFASGGQAGSTAADCTLMIDSRSAGKPKSVEELCRRIVSAF